jgi:hypothetical protein
LEICGGKIVRMKSCECEREDVYILADVEKLQSH